MYGRSSRTSCISILKGGLIKNKKFNSLRNTVMWIGSFRILRKKQGKKCIFVISWDWQTVASSRDQHLCRPIRLVMNMKRPNLHVMHVFSPVLTHIWSVCLMRSCGLIVCGFAMWVLHRRVMKCHFCTSLIAYFLWKYQGSSYIRSFSCSVVVNSFHRCLRGVSGLFALIKNKI